VATNISSLTPITLDYTRKGPGLHVGSSQVKATLDANRTGFLLIDAIFESGTVSVIMRRSDLYLLGFQSADGWWRFSDAEWPLIPAASSLGFEGRYDALGGLVGSLRLGDLKAVGKLLDPGSRHQWKSLLRTLLIVVSENLRLIPVNMLVLSLLNEIKESISLDYLAPYIQNWRKASEGRDMSVQAGPNLRSGFKNPTIVKL
jgi:hypothetical protein